MIRRTVGARAVLLLPGLVVLAGAWKAQEPPPPVAYRPPPPPRQPIAYSHKQHLAQELACATCHATAGTETKATLPLTVTCMGCHATVKTDSPDIQKLATFHLSKEDVPWARVYRLPEYVYFSHKVHAAGTPPMTCETCHGNVRDMDVMQKVTDISMAACVQCHQQRLAANRCDTCHELR